MENVPRVLAGRYEVGELIGRGGMAEVYVGRDTRLSRTVAIKLLRPELSEDPTFHARFHREAQSAAALNHPAIVAVYDTGEEPVLNAAGKEVLLPFIVMEYVEGHTVRDLLKDGAAVPIDEAVEIVVGILGALEYAHNEGIVHRDIKPGNVMLTPTGQVKVMDFGIARALADQSATMTQTNSVVGTAQYLSPEQARGETVDTRSDIYSTGCVLFELLTGHPPFTGDSAVSVAYQHVRELPPTPSSIASDIPDSLDRVVMKALAKDRNTRYADAAAFRSDLLTVLHGGRVSAPATTAWMAPAVAAADATQVVGAPAAMAANPPTTTMEAAAPLDDPDEPGSKWWIWLLLGLAIIGGAIAWWILRDTGDDAEPIVMPEDVIGMTQPEAESFLTELAPDLGLEFRVTDDPIASDDIEEGHVAAVDPDVGEELTEGATVFFTLSSGPETFALEDLTDMEEQAALDRLEELGLIGELASERVASDDVDEGHVISTNPPADDPVKKGDTVTLTVSSGPGEIVLADLVGMSLSEAQRWLSDNDLVFSGSTTVDSPGADRDEVVETSPPAGTSLEKGNEVALVVASGNVIVPNVVGALDSPMMEEAATSLLREDGLTVAIEREYSDTWPEGTVMSQSRQADSVVAQGTEVTIVVSRGVDPNSVEPEPEPTEDEDTSGDDAGTTG